MQNNPEVSILMPVYNGEKYLKEAINSVLNQTFTDFEFIIINDGSTDGAEAIIQSYDDERIRYVKQSNQGVAQSLNNGLKVASGKYIWRHDADDICLPDQLDKQFNFLEKHPEFALVSTQIAFMTDRGKIAHSYKQPKDDYFNKQAYTEVKKAHFNPYSPITHATVLMLKNVINALGAYRTEFKTSEDTDLWLRILEKNKAAVLNYCSYFVRLNKASATQRFKSSINYYRDLAFQYTEERRLKGTDPIMRGESVPPPPKVELVETCKVPGKTYRNDLLDFRYNVMLNAKDWKNTWQCIYFAINDGWKLKQTWKTIMFPILGKKLVQLGIIIKSAGK